MKTVLDVLHSIELLFTFCMTLLKSMVLKLWISFLFVFPALKRPGERLWLTCAVSGFSLTSCGISWIRQVSGKELEWIGDIWHGGGTAYSTIFQSRASITKDNSKSEVYLQLNALKAEDTAVYYCIRHNERNLLTNRSKTTTFQI
uniref:Ig-like domain-containing protein n=1 Tax=Naja naja TaxID=35670 RepID=A0A8C6X5D6_NAJNA